MKNLETRLHWIFRIAVAAEFIGHGSFGIITKASWVPYFAVFGIGEQTAYKLMPLIGAMDITLGIAALFIPVRFILYYMTFWGLWTACLRPISGEPVWEAIERASNYGVPLAFLVLCGWNGLIKGRFSKIDLQPLKSPKTETLALVLRLTTGFFLIGHGALAALTHKNILIRQLESVNLISSAVPHDSLLLLIGWLEIILGVGVLIYPVPWLLLFIMIWKIATESLYPLSGAPVWEFIERGGNYAAPLALYLVERWRAAPDHYKAESIQRAASA